VILLRKAIRQAANLLLARRPQFVIVGTGRCGTAFAARRLTDLGITCSHEEYYTTDGPRLRNRWRFFGTKGEASGLAPPFLRPGEMPVVHLVRRPGDVIRSLYNIGVFDPDFRADHEPYVAFDERYVDLGRDPFEACMRWYLEWNRRCEQVAGLRVRIEHFDESLPQIFAHIGFAPTRDAPPPARNWNTRPSVYSDPLSLREIERRIAEHPLGRELAEMARRYGYGPGLTNKST
jgi:hypothetical protein